MPETTQTRPPGKSASTILVMEPDILVRMAISDYLRECGYKVLESSSDDDVLAVLNAASDIDVVFSGAPTTSESDGFALAHRIRIARPDVDVILTAGIENAATKAAEVCSDGPLTKTFNPKDLVKRIHLLRERHRTSKFSR
jgi:DNA-binding response OmpR family regulator